MNLVPRTTLLAALLNLGCGTKSGLRIPDTSQSCSDIRGSIASSPLTTYVIDSTTRPSSLLMAFSWMFAWRPREFDIEMARGGLHNDFPQCAPSDISSDFVRVAVVPLPIPTPPDQIVRGVRVYLPEDVPVCIRVTPVYTDCRGTLF